MGQTATVTSLPVASLIKSIRSLIEKGDLATEKADTYYIQAGTKLRELKECKPDDIPWPEYVKRECGLGRDRADELIRIAESRTTVEKVRADNAERMRKSRADNPLSRDNGSDDDTKVITYPNGTKLYTGEVQPDETLDDETDTDDARKLSFIMRAGQALRYATYDGPIDNAVAKAARQTADAWTKLANRLGGKLND